MTKKPQKQKITVNRKLVAALTIIVVLALSIAFVTLGVTGRKMDAQGLYNLLPWLPTPGESTNWRQALVPGAGLDDSVVVLLSPAGSETGEEEMKAATRVLVKRLGDFGWADTAVQVKEGKLEVTLPKSADVDYLKTLLTAKGEYTFETPEGEVFMTGENVTTAGFGYADQSGQNIALSMVFDSFGKDAFGTKTGELSGQNITLKRDGEVVVSPSIGEAITQGMVSIPGFTLDSARENAVLLRSGALPFALAQEGDSLPGRALLLGESKDLIIYAFVAVFAILALYLIARFRLGGLIAAWMLLMQLALSYFFAALIGAGYTVLTLSAIYAALLVSFFAVNNLFLAIQEDARQGRSIRQAIKDGYAGKGHASLDVFAGLLLLFIVFIMMDQGIIKMFSEVIAIGLLLGLIMVHLVLRLLLNESIHLFGGKNSLFTSNNSVKKEG
jgi:preprotein translocase subunit SecD